MMMIALWHLLPFVTATGRHYSFSLAVPGTKDRVRQSVCMVGAMARHSSGSIHLFAGSGPCRHSVILQRWKQL